LPVCPWQEEEFVLKKWFTPKIKKIIIIINENQKSNDYSRYGDLSSIIITSYDKNDCSKFTLIDSGWGLKCTLVPIRHQ